MERGFEGSTWLLAIFLFYLELLGIFQTCGWNNYRLEIVTSEEETSWTSHSWQWCSTRLQSAQSARIWFVSCARLNFNLWENKCPITLSLCPTDNLVNVRWQFSVHYVLSRYSTPQCQELFHDSRDGLATGFRLQGKDRRQESAQSRCQPPCCSFDCGMVVLTEIGILFKSSKQSARLDRNAHFQ